MAILVEYAGCKTDEERAARRDRIRRDNELALVDRMMTRAEKRMDQLIQRSRSKSIHNQLVVQRRQARRNKIANPAPVVQSVSDIPQPKVADLPLSIPRGKGIFPGHWLYEPWKRWLGERKGTPKLVREFVESMGIKME
jgi:hypothetical protein